MSVKATIVGNVGKVGETKTGKVRFSVASGKGEKSTWYTVIGDIIPPNVGDRVEVQGDLVLTDPWQDKSQATLFLGNGLRVFPKRETVEKEDLSF